MKNNIFCDENYVIHISVFRLNYEMKTNHIIISASNFPTIALLEKSADACAAYIPAVCSIALNIRN